MVRIWVGVVVGTAIVCYMFMLGGGVELAGFVFFGRYDCGGERRGGEGGGIALDEVWYLRAIYVCLEWVLVVGCMN